jgi:PAS domain-containing protein
VKLLTHPVFVRMAAVWLLSTAAFVVGIVLMRWLRRRMLAEERVPVANEHAVPFHTCAVIQQLKQQKFTLENERRVQSRRAKTSEQITSAMMAHVPCGVLFITPNGIVHQANAAARQILGFRSPIGMSVGELFRHTTSRSQSGAQVELGEAVATALGGTACPAPIESRYRTPAGEERTLEFSFVPILAASGDRLGVAAVFSNETDVAELRETRLLREEASAEMILELRSSLSSIRQWAAQIVPSAAAQGGQNLAADIVAEAERLDQYLSRFVSAANGAFAVGA